MSVPDHFLTDVFVRFISLNVMVITKSPLANNNLKGYIPEEIKYFPYIKTWITPFNADLTTKNSLDPFLYQGSQFTHLELQYCGIAGTIPEQFGNSMQDLNYLGLGTYN